MRVIFADTANLTEIKELSTMGVIRGVTTNPSIIAKEPKTEFDSLINKLADFCAMHKYSLSVEVFTESPDEILKQGFDLHKSLSNRMTSDNIYIKVPVGVEEIKIIRQFADQGINVNCTACFTEQQMQAAALAGAKYVSLFYNRAKDAGIDVHQVLERTSNFISINKLSCEIIAGSIRKPQDISEAWDAGADIVTCSTKIIKEMLQHEGTTKSIEGFMKDFANWLK
jgi:transaldolase